MGVPNRQIGWSNESNLLWSISKQLEKINCQVCALDGAIVGPAGPEGPQGIQGDPGPQGIQGIQGIQGPAGPMGGGLYSQTADSVAIAATTTESTLIGSGVGTLTVPPNAFAVGDTYTADMSGRMDAANNQTIRIRVKAGATILLDSGVQTLTSSINDDIWTLSLDFTIRQVGVAGVASVASYGRFSYAKTNNGTVEGFGLNTINNTTFDTTVGNTLEITLEWGSANVNNTIHSDIFVLSKIY